jgi:hypothetical protein
MWALVKRSDDRLSVDQVFRTPSSIRIDDILHPPGMFSSSWTDAERKAIGIYNYKEVNADFDDRFYTLGTDETSIDASAGLVTVTYTNAAKNLSSTKTARITTAKQQANSFLKDTDWQELAKLTRSRTIDSDVATYRAAVLTAYGDIKTLINNQNTMAKLAALYSADGDDKPDINKWPDPI